MSNGRETCPSLGSTILKLAHNNMKPPYSPYLQDQESYKGVNRTLVGPGVSLSDAGGSETPRRATRIQSFLRKGELLAYVGLHHILKDLKKIEEPFAEYPGVVGLESSPPKMVSPLRKRRMGGVAE